MAYSLKENLMKEDRLSGGHRMCAGCGSPIAVRTVLRALNPEDHAVVCSATSCLEVSTFMYPYTAWKDSFIHNAFENAAATISGVETAYRAMKKRGKLGDTYKFIAFGGDGTILHLSKTAAHRDIPVLGVNLGSLGFMAELEQKELCRLGELMDEKYTVESRMMLDVSVVREGRVIYSNLALNEAVVTRGAVSRVIRLHIRTEQGRLLDVTGDGVIVASPTGSTAYSLSAGGPVVEPTARNLIVSPICAHSVHANSYVLSPERTVTVQTEKTGYKPIFLSADGGRAFSLRNGDAVEIRRSKYETKLVRLFNKSFCDILQKKMLMGVLGHEE